METGYQRGKIQEESYFYEHPKHSSYPDHRAEHFLQSAFMTMAVPETMGREGLLNRTTNY